MARKIEKRTKSTKLAITTDCTAIYIRVSTDKQADEGYSLDAQRNKLTGYCAAMGWNVCEDSIFIDAGESGKSTARPAYQRMIAAIDAGAVNRIVATKLDRLSRNTRDFLTLLDYCDARDIAIVSIGENFDTSDPIGRAIVTVLMTFAELERTQITGRVMTGKREKAQRGGYNGSQTPFGYTYQDSEFAIDDHAAAIVRRIFNEWNAGKPMAHIAASLNADGFSSPRGATWSTPGIRHMLHNGAYAGLSQWNGVEAQAGVYPAIIDVATYEAASSRLATVKPGRQASR